MKYMTIEKLKSLQSQYFNIFNTNNCNILNFNIFKSLLIIGILNFGIISANADLLTVCKDSCNYPDIQIAINMAKNGDNIQVHSGIYQGNIKVNKQLVITGIDSGNGMPVIDSNGTNGVNLTAGNTTFEGFKVINAGNIQNPVGIAGIRLSSENNIVRNNIVSNDEQGIRIFKATGNRVSFNIAENNYLGIYLQRSENNIVRFNTVIDNNCDGIYLYYSNNNRIVGNNASYNKFDGIGLWNSSNNSIFHNNMINNSAYNDLINFWDNGTNGGNYWSNYKGVDNDSDGFGDTPININGNAQDRYPLMFPWKNKKGDLIGDGNITIVDALIISQYAVGLKFLSPQQLEVADVNGDGQVNIIDALFIAQYTVGIRQSL